jgi:hypothetical protein
VLSTVNIPSTSLVQGLNIIQVKAKNAPGCAENLYQCNPAGVVLGASFQDALTALPKCTSNGKTYDVGQTETLPCPPEKDGSRSRPCICFGNRGVWGSIYGECKERPPTCAGINGGIFKVGETETLPCPLGQIGSVISTCQSDGSWNVSKTCETICTGINGGIFKVGEKETLPKPCPPGQIGSVFGTCQSDGSWVESNTCHIPQVGVGDMCLDKDGVEVGICPAGTTCKPRIVSRKRPVPLWCIFVLWIPPQCDPGENIQTADSFCLP